MLGVLIQSLKSHPNSGPVERADGSFKKLYLKTRGMGVRQLGTGDCWAAVVASPKDALTCHGLHQAWSPISLISLLLGTTQVQDSEVCKCPWPSGPSSELWGLKYKCLSEPM